MKLISTLIVILLVTGCTSMKPVELSRDQIQDRISLGEVIHEGDTVRIVTDEGKKHKFEVTAITDDSIVGNNIEVPITNIAAIETKEHSVGKTGGLAASSVVLVFIAFAAAAAF